jgi:hypothetical protein
MAIQLSTGKAKPKPQQISEVVASVVASTTVAAAIAAGTITQDRVSSIVTAAINQLRAGE